jgi:hypothetical protein
MSTNIKILIVISCITLPMIGYFYMVIVQKNVKFFIETKTINKGIYKNKPVYGDEVIPIANSFKRVAKIFFVFSIVISLLFAVLLYLNWS